MNIEILHNPVPQPPPNVVLDLTLEEFAVLRVLAYRHLSLGDRCGSDFYNDLKEMDDELGLKMKGLSGGGAAVTTYFDALRYAGLDS